MGMKEGGFRVIEGGWTGYQAVLESERQVVEDQKAELKTSEKKEEKKGKEIRSFASSS
jgi:hypothetical protein